MASIVNPSTSSICVGPGQPILFESDAPFNFTASVNGGVATQFGTATTQAVYTTPNTVTNTDANGNATMDLISIEGTDGYSASFISLMLVSGIPDTNCSGPMGNPTTGGANPKNSNPNSNPGPTKGVDGVNDVSVTPGTFMDTDNGGGQMTGGGGTGTGNSLTGTGDAGGCDCDCPTCPPPPPPPPPPARPGSSWYLPAVPPHRQGT